MSVFQPRAVFKAQINDVSIAKGARTITFDNVSLGSIADIEPNFLMLVGTTAGARDKGTIRVRSASGSSIVVSENSNISWANDLFISVLRFVRLDPIFPRIISDPSNAENTLWYKDYDLTYTNQNSILGSVPCMGADQALFKGEQVYYSATGTYNARGETLYYNWAFEGGTPTGSTSETPGLVSYPSPGHYVTRLMISGSLGSNETSYRCVSVYDKPGEGSSTPVEMVEIRDIHGSREEGGYETTVRVHKNVPIDEDSVVVFFTEDWYGSTKQSIGGNSPNNERIFFVGRVLKGTIRKNYRYSYVEFSVGSITKVMKQAQGFSVSVESKPSPSVWYELLDMDCRRAMYHYLKWHTTLLSVADFQFLGDDRKIQFFDADRTSIFDALDTLMRNTLLGKVVADRQGKVWAEIDARAYPNPTGSFTSVMDITKRDWMGEPTIEQEFSDRLSYYEAGGIAYSGVVTGTFAALLACAPGSSPSFRGSIETPDGLALLGQTQLNQLVGNVWANANSRLPRISMDMDINARNLDIAPQESVKMTIQASDTIAQIPVDSLYQPNEMNWRYDSKNKILLPSIDFVNLVTGEPGETIVTPANASDAGFDSGGFSVPSLQIPPLPLLTIPPLLSGMTTGSSCCDYLGNFGVGRGVFSCVYQRAAATPQYPPFPFVDTGLFWGWEYASNPAMYNADTGNMPLINTGTVNYEFRLSGDWSVVSYSAAGNAIVTVGVNLYDNLGSFIDSPVGYEIASLTLPGGHIGVVGGTTPGNGGHFSISAIISSSNYKKPNYMHALISSNVSPPEVYQVIFSNLRLEVTGT